MEEIHTAQPTTSYASMRPFLYVHNVIQRHADKELFADDDWHWLKSVVQANKLDVASAGLWQDPKESSVQLALTPQGNVRLLA